MIDITGLDKSAVLAALYNNSRAQGLGALDPRSSQRMTSEQAAAYIERSTEFDYLNGRVMKIDLSADTFDERLYDRDNGHGAAERAIAPLRAAA